MTKKKKKTQFKVFNKLQNSWYYSLILRNPFAIKIKGNRSNICNTGLLASNKWIYMRYKNLLYIHAIYACKWKKGKFNAIHFNQKH